MINKNILIFAVAVQVLLFACKKDVVLSSEKEIIDVTVEYQVGNTVVDKENAEVTLLVEREADLISVSPQITISPLASIVPASGSSQDFSLGPITYTVTAEDESSQEWEIEINNELRSDAEILTFKISSWQSGETVIDGTNISIKVVHGIDLSKLVPKIEISEGATISPGHEEETDFSAGPVTYIVTAENGSTKEWNVTVTWDLNHLGDILSYTIPGQIGESVFAGKTISIDVPFGTDLSDIIPEIVISEGASISPASGESVDFSITGSVDYTVTAEKGYTRNWTVFAHYPVISADNPNYQYVGRFDFNDPKKPKVWTPGAYIFAKFSGNYCEIAINDEVLYGTSYNYLEVVIDGTQHLRLKTEGAQNSFSISEYLSDGEHTLLIVKSTETGMGFIEFLGLRCEALLTPDQLLGRKIEFIGNSITVAQGVDNSDIPCGEGSWYDYHNAYKSYGAITARNLNAQWHISAVAGIGLVQSCCGMGFVMPDVFDKMNLRSTGDTWNFSNYIPDVVTICLGQNDGIQDSVLFCSSYVEFIDDIRTYYPNTAIVCLNSPLADDNLNDALDNYLTGIVTYMNGKGDAKVYKFMFSNNHTGGCDFHPSEAEHQLIADELTEFLQTTMGW